MDTFAEQTIPRPCRLFFTFLDKYAATLRCHLGIFAQMPYKRFAVQSIEWAAVAPVT